MMEVTFSTPSAVAGGAGVGGQTRGGVEEGKLC